jgi:integrase
MPRPATGQIVVDGRGEARTFALRFRAYGKREYVTLGSTADGWSHARAQEELENVLADVRRGLWRPAVTPAAPQPLEDPTFHEFASRWFEGSKGEWRPKTALDYHWQLHRHLLPFFKDHRLSQITVAEVDRYRQMKVAEANAIRATQAKSPRQHEEYVDRNGQTRRRAVRPLSSTSINKTITRLGQILEVALEYGLIESNPARGRRRRLRTQRPVPVWLDRAEHVEALLSAAAELDAEALEQGGREPRGGVSYRHPLLATLVFAGLRIGELIALRWRDVDLAGGRLAVRESKTDAGIRHVDLLPVLLHALEAHRSSAAYLGMDAFVFVSAAGTELKQSNIRRRVLDQAVGLANKRLEAAGHPPLPAGLTPHKLRHTFASLLVAIGVDPGSVMDQLGHADPGFTLRIYRHTMRRHQGERDRLRRLVEGASKRRKAV